MSSGVVYHQSERLCLYTAFNAQICIVQGDLDAAGMRCIADHYRSLSRRYADGVVGLAIIGEGTPVAGREALSEARVFLTELREAIRMIAVVIEEQGVAAQMLASVVRGLNVFSRRKRLSVVTDVREAATALAPHLLEVEPADAESALLRAVDEARRAAGARKAS